MWTNLYLQKIINNVDDSEYPNLRQKLTSSLASVCSTGYLIDKSSEKKDAQLRVSTKHIFYR